MRTAFVAFVAGLLVIAPQAAAQTAPTLSGEEFVAEDELGLGVSDPTPGTSVEINFRCTDSFTSVVDASFRARGVATGPVSGEFTESGQYEEFQEPPFGQDGHARFAVRSADGSTGAVGRKFGMVGFLSACFDTETSDRLDLVIDSRYEALVRTPDGAFLDRGRAFITLRASRSTVPEGTFIDERFTQSFLSEGSTPFTKHDCKADENALLVEGIFGPDGEKECKAFAKGKDG